MFKKFFMNTKTAWIHPQIWIIERRRRMTLEMNTITIYFMYIKKNIFNVAKKSRQRSVRESGSWSIMIMFAKAVSHFCQLLDIVCLLSSHSVYFRLRIGKFISLSYSQRGNKVIFIYVQKSSELLRFIAH